MSASSAVPARDDKPVPSALTSTVSIVERPITFKVNLLAGGLLVLTTAILPARADVSDHPQHPTRERY